MSAHHNKLALLRLNQPCPPEQKLPNIGPGQTSGRPDHHQE